MKNIYIILLLIISTNSFAQTKAFEVSVTGQGEPILLFPGFTCTEEIWDDTVDLLSKNYECHTFTFAGFGDVAPIKKPWLPKIKEEIEKYIIENKLKKPSIIGHSLGGTLALWLASENEITYNKLLLVDALPSAGALMIPNYKSEAVVYDSPYTKQQLEMDTLAFKAMAQQIASFMSLNKEKHQQIIDWMLQADRETYVYGYIDLLKVDLRASISNIKTPVKVLAATHPDKETIQLNYTKQFSKLPNVEIVYANDSAHFIMFDQPEWYKEQVLNYFNINE